MRTIMILVFLVTLSFAYAQDASAGGATTAPTEATPGVAPAAAPDATAPTAATTPTSDATSPTAAAPNATAPAAATPDTTTATTPEAAPATTSGAAPGAAPAPAASQEAGSADLLAEVERLGAKLEEANSVIDELRAQANDLRDKADASDAAAKAAQAQAAASDQAAKAAEEKAQALADKAAQADQLSAQAADLRAKAADLEAKIAELEKEKEGITNKMLSFGNLKLDKADYPQVILSGFSGAEKRMGSWSIDGAQASQTDSRQFFSRLTFPVVQSSTPTLYSFDVRAGSAGWVGAGLHFFAASIKKPHGYGEGKSLLVWLTRDQKVRGGPQTYLQLYRSDDDVNMERVLDALIKEGIVSWHHLDVLYDPSSEFVVVAIDGSVRAAYRTFFGIGAGVSVSLRTLGAGVAFKNFEVRR